MTYLSSGLDHRRREYGPHACLAAVPRNAQPKAGTIEEVHSCRARSLLLLSCSCRQMAAGSQYAPWMIRAAEVRELGMTAYAARRTQRSSQHGPSSIGSPTRYLPGSRYGPCVRSAASPCKLATEMRPNSDTRFLPR